jgi:hypothetical protein
MKKAFKIVGYSFLALTVMALLGNLFGESQHENRVKTDELIAKAYQKISEDDLEGAMIFTMKADSINSDNDYTLPSELMLGIPKLVDKNYQDTLLVSLNDKELNELENKALKKTYLADSALNSKLINNLYQRRNEIGPIKKEWEKQEKQLALEKADSDKSVRIASQQIIRNNFLDNGLDIQVSIRGKNKDHLHLKYALFGDVWFRKFETEGMFNQYHELGFKKVTLTDGYDYTKYVYWE